MAQLIHAADAIRTNTAGVKGEVDKVKNVATAEVAPAVRRVFTDPMAALGLSGGPHPESALTAISSALVRGTDAVAGPHGGLVPAETSVTAPGPGGSTNAQAAGLGASFAKVAGESPAAGAARRGLNRLRKVVGG